MIKLRKNRKLESIKFRPKKNKLSWYIKYKLSKLRDSECMLKQLPIKSCLKLRRLSALQIKQLKPLKKSALRLKRRNIMKLWQQLRNLNFLRRMLLMSAQKLYLSKLQTKFLIFMHNS